MNFEELPAQVLYPIICIPDADYLQDYPILFKNNATQIFIALNNEIVFYEYEIKFKNHELIIN